jgi:hypothetical protein
MVRGAIAYGDFFVDPEVDAYVGQALIEAYRLEGQQDWLALSLDASLTATPQFAKALEEHPGFIGRSLAPLRDSDEKPYCINWADKSI